ncbi:MAG TPA: NAD(P)/FAD-dependent oxidoreductase [Nevskiaceae bacterium]
MAQTDAQAAMIPTRTDIVIVGSGINSLVAAATLGLAGREVTIVERSPVMGGFIASGEVTRPGFIHDLYSSWHPLFMAGGSYARLGPELTARGLRYANSDDAVCAAISPDAPERGAAIAYRDPKRTITGFSNAADGAAYLAMLDELQTRAPVVFGALGAELGTRKALAKLGWHAWRTLGTKGLDALARDGLSSGRAYLRRHFRGWEVDALWTPWLLHAGLSPDHASGGVMIPILAASMHGFGLPVVVGGVSHFLDAFRALFKDHGVQVVTGVEVQNIIVENGRTHGVHTSAGDIQARAVLANVSPPALYGALLPQLPQLAAQRAAASWYRAGRAAMQVHLALDKPVEWIDARLKQVPIVHLTNGAGSTGVACAQAEAGLLPDAPTIVVGQQSFLDPSRAPAGKATLWLQLQEVPYAPVGDSRGEIDTAGGWRGDGMRDAYLSRVLERVERVAPGFRSTILGTRVFTPVDLEAKNPNARGGDPYAGAADIDQNLFWRPFPGAARHETVIRGLWHIGASTHPGPGLGGESGRLAAEQVLKRIR